MQKYFSYPLLIYLLLLCFPIGCSFKERPEDNKDNTATTTEIRITRNDGSIEELHFKQPLELTNVGINPLAFVMKDLNQDGRKDLALLNSAIDEKDQFLRILIRTSIDAPQEANDLFEDPILKKTKTFLRPQYLIVEDFSKDQIQDVLIAYPETDRVSYWQGTLSGTHYSLASTSKEVKVGDFPTFMAVGNLNAPSQFIAIANQSSDNISILSTPTTTKTLLGKDQGVEPDPIQLVTGDWNNDGCQDLASLSHNQGRTNFFKQTSCSGNASLEKLGEQKVGSKPKAIIAGDWDHDGQTDVAVTNSKENSVSLLYGKGNGTFERFDVSVGEGPGQLAFSDFNGDGVEDFVIGSLIEKDLSILLSNGDGKRPSKNKTAYAHADIVAGSVLSGNRPAFIAIVDINHDGKPDIVLTLPYQNKFSILLQE